MSYQKTLRSALSFTGIGLHSGKEVALVIHPAPSDHGIVFRRVDIGENNEVHAIFSNVSNTMLSTTISNDHGVSVSTIEHLMAALYGSGIDNAFIELNSFELPILDGSADLFYTRLKNFTIPVDKERRWYSVSDRISVQDGQSIAIAEPLAGKPGLVIEITIDFANKVIGNQTFKIDFREETFDMVSNSRTFVEMKDIEYLRKQGLALGGSLDNAVVVDGGNILNEEGLRHHDEFVRHKMLDCIGDLFLAGHHLHGHIKIIQPGHKINNLLLRQIMQCN